MAKRRKNNHNITSFSMEGDVIKVELVDTGFNIYFKGKANINNKNQMSKLAEELANNGVSFPKTTLKKIDDFLDIKELEKWL